MSTRADVFTNVHKGIRHALFDACSALGRVGNDPTADREARELLGRALRFVERHGENEDALFLPLLDERAPEVATRLRTEHATVEVQLDRLRQALAGEDSRTLYLETSRFVAHYLLHMAGEELELEERIRAVITDEELRQAGQRAVAETAPAERAMMLALMMPALPPAEADGLRSRLPPASRS